MGTTFIKDDHKTYIPNLMIPYFEYFSKNLSVYGPTWTEIYEDRFGFGDVVTVGMPIRIGEELVGVVGLDVTVKYIEK